MNVSVAMATYNGEKFLKEQIDSILCQLEAQDELIVSDDGSSDATLEILKEYRKDKRVQVFVNPSKGVVSNFENALKQCQNDLIFLSDQDDIWLPEKVHAVKECLEHSGKLLVLHNGINFYEDTGASGDLLIKRMRHGVAVNILKSCYWGCCMAFKRELLHWMLPFPPQVPAHDQWIGLVAEKIKETLFLDQPFLLHRRHGANVSKSLPIFKKIKFRYDIAASFLSKGISEKVSSKKSFDLVK